MDLLGIAIMQPYFFPYIGYFSLIANTDFFVFFDTPQYTPRSWMNRNRIINIKQGFTYITAAVQKAPQKTAIKDIYLAESDSWSTHLLAQLTVYKKIAPYYKQTIDVINHIASRKYTRLSDLNIESTIAVCDYLGIPLHSNVFSQMDLTLGEIHEPDEWALQITKALGFSTYINPPGGMSFFDREKYLRDGIALQFLQADIQPYDQHIGRFEAGLSIIDVMMFCSPAEIIDMLKLYTLL